MLDDEFLFDNFEKTVQKEHTLSEPETSNSRKRKRGGSVAEENGSECHVEEHNQLLEQLQAKECLVQDLEKQNEKLKAVIKRLCGPQEMSSDFHELLSGGMSKEVAAQLPVAVVLSFNNAISSLLQPEVDSLMKTISNKTIEEKDLVEQQVCGPQPAAVPLRAFASDVHGNRRHAPKTDLFDPHVVTATQYYVGYCMDRLGYALYERSPSLSEAWCVPDFEQVYRHTLPVDEDMIVKSAMKRTKKTCFNCGGEHEMSACSQPRDHAKINANRKQFMDKMGSPMIRRARYHVSSGGGTAVHDFKPGVLTNQLREALGIGSTQLPPYIYRMRTLGYPPGYSQPADESLHLYNETGVAQSIGDDEDGEIKPDATPLTIRYPGFNCPLPEGAVDQYRDFYAPPFFPLAVNPNFYPTPEPVKPRAADHTEADSMDIDDPGAVPIIQLDEPTLPPGVESSGTGESPVVCMDDSNQELPDKEDNRSEEEDFILLDETEISNDVPPVLSCNGSKDRTDAMDQPTSSALEMKRPLSNLTDAVNVNDLITAEKASGVRYRRWWTVDNSLHTSTQTRPVLHQPPPSCKYNVTIDSIPNNLITFPELIRDRSECDLLDPLYGNLATPTGTYKNIKTTLKGRKPGARLSF